MKLIILAGWFSERVSDSRFFWSAASACFSRTSWWASILGPFPCSPESYGWAVPFSNARECIMGKKLYCGNLSYNVSNSDLDQIFGEYGTVQSAEVIMDRDTGRSKGFGFVEMSTDEEAQAAIAGVNGKEHDGRTLTVNEARPRENRGGGGGGGGRGGGGGGRGGYGGGGGGGGGGRRY
jgi:uncharacterized membrane protein YgcG